MRISARRMCFYISALVRHRYKLRTLRAVGLQCFCKMLYLMGTNCLARQGFYVGISVFVRLNTGVCRRGKTYLCPV